MLKTREIEQRMRPKGRFAHIDGVRLHYLDVGSGDPVVLIHGNTVSSEDWLMSGVLDRLAGRYRVIAPDRPGLGHSERPRDRLWTPAKQAAVIAQLLDQLAIEPAIIVAHSLGVQTALELALQRPQRVRGLVLMSGYYRPTPRLDSLVLGFSALPIVGDLWRYTLANPIGQMTIDAAAKAMFSPMDPPAQFTRDVLEPGLRPLQTRAIAEDSVYMLMQAGALRARLEEIAAPIVLIAGTDDRVVPPEHQSAQIARELMDATLHELPGKGHMLHYSCLDEIVAAIGSLDDGPSDIDLDDRNVEAAGSDVIGDEALTMAHNTPPPEAPTQELPTPRA
jgi:pimeloyl-ACP methyl ester carboxylesterase